MEGCGDGGDDGQDDQRWKEGGGGGREMVVMPQLNIGLKLTSPSGILQKIKKLKKKIACMQDGK